MTYTIFQSIYPVTPSTTGIKAKIEGAIESQTSLVTEIKRENHDSHNRKVKKGKKKGLYFSKSELFNLKLLSRWVTRFVK
jgi:LEA14-like dessication related protein